MTAWSLLLAELMRGLVHSINNRVAAMNAYVDLADMDGELMEVALFRPELARLHEANSLIGRLADPDDRIEALEVRPVLDLAIRIHNFHPHAPQAACVVRQDEPVHPVRTQKSAALRLLLLMVNAGCNAGARPAYLRVFGDREVTRVSVAAVEAVSEEAAQLAAQCGGSLTSTGNDIVFEIATLPALKR